MRAVASRSGLKTSSPHFLAKPACGYAGLDQTFQLRSPRGGNSPLAHGDVPPRQTVTARAGTQVLATELRNGIPGEGIPPSLSEPFLPTQLQVLVGLWQLWSDRRSLTPLPWHELPAATRVLVAESGTEVSRGLIPSSIRELSLPKPLQVLGQKSRGRQFQSP